MSSQYLAFLEELSDVSWIAYDTEFISEGRYQPDLCLVQVATAKGLYLIDALRIEDLSEFWRLLCRDSVLPIAHSCRSELEFCFRSISRIPPRMFDVQLAAAFVGLGYPLNFKSLVQEVVNIDIPKTETRSDWTRRPLLTSQLDYAIEDVIYLREIADVLGERLNKRKRQDWFEEEMRSYCQEMESSFSDGQWHKLVGKRNLSSNELAIVRELWRWRRQRAITRNCTPNRILRDDVIIELARRGSWDPNRIAVVRSLNSTATSTLVQQLSECIKRAVSLDDAEKPHDEQHSSYPQYAMATQFLNVLMAQYCQHRGVAPKLCFTAEELRKAIASHEGLLPENEISRLNQGWRREFIGDYLKKILEGRYVMQFSNDLEHNPLRLVEHAMSSKTIEKESKPQS